MGDADSQQPEGYDDQQLTSALDALDEDISQLHQTVHDLEERTLRAVSMQVKGYEDFRLFFISMNILILPVVIALGICFHLRLFIVDETVQVALNTIILLLLFLSGVFGVPLYLGALWAMYRFKLPQDLISDEFFRSFVIEFRDLDALAPDSANISREDSSAESIELRPLPELQENESLDEDHHGIETEAYDVLIEETSSSTASESYSLANDRATGTHVQSFQMRNANGVPSPNWNHLPPAPYGGPMLETHIYSTLHL